VAHQTWDAVVDVSRQPGQVRAAADSFSRQSASFVFISSVSAYRDTHIAGEDETAALLPPLESDVMESMQTYGEAKVACEQHVLASFGPSRSVIVRVGLIGGPGDIFDRSGYWPLRFARPAATDDGVLIPDVPG
jgi:nucleoside-diphosphate-sugar epimerase